MDKFKIMISIDQIYIDSYDEIVLFDEEEIILKYKDQYIMIKGQELAINRLLNNELLINGKFHKVELSNVSR